ncbi:trehalase family glycosidase [Zunongwangia sp. F363]|uniref:Trehalase family glycosidase n=1 Tax=Autumnicola tepida TaxID=3075595 RepID=A0ABU3C851_9FLAO|nr:trehalase family glycosidase [Zunongwangia sp. F363]MDT0642518.1 trehalase family glycosidase [Zunongwangia sp. F363]
MTDEELFKKVREIIYENMEKASKDGSPPYHYTRPAPERYPYQFFWDTCFHVFILVSLGEIEMAKEHIKSLLRLQREDGFIGHMIYWDRLKPGRWADFFQSKFYYKNLYRSHMSSLIQPPLLAQAVSRIVKNSENLNFLKEVLPNLKAYYDWLDKNRDFDGDGLLTIISPFESGMDWKPTYDVPLGFTEGKANTKLYYKVIWTDFLNFINNYNLKKIYRKGHFLVKDAGLNTFYAQNLFCLGELCEMLQDQDAKVYYSRAKEVSRNIVKVLYDEQDAAFYDVYGKENLKIKVETPTIFYPLALSSVPEVIKVKVLERHFLSSEKFDTYYPIPSVAKDSSAFNPKESIYIWRGPTWIVNNWFLHQILEKNNYTESSQKLTRIIIQLIEKSGFREYYNPFTGEGYGAKDFTWAGLVLDMMNTNDKNLI